MRFGSEKVLLVSRVSECYRYTLLDATNHTDTTLTCIRQINLHYQTTDFAIKHFKRVVDNGKNSGGFEGGQRSHQSAFPLSENVSFWQSCITDSANCSKCITGKVNSFHYSANVLSENICGNRFGTLV